MAIEFNTDVEVKRRTRTSTPLRIADYPVYPSQRSESTASDPYIPETDAEPWWDRQSIWSSNWASDPSKVNPLGDLTSDERKVVSDLVELLDKNKTLVFSKDKHYISSAGYKRNMAYAGNDMTVVATLPGCPPYVFDDLQTISVSTHRESFPVRTLGMSAPLGFTSGARTIAGSMIFSLMEAYPWYKMAREVYGQTATSLWDNTTAAEYPLADTLPPFDITITFSNEYEPQGAALRIFGVKIIDDGSNFSIDDLVTENTFSFMATGIAPVHKAKKWSVTK